MVMRMNTHGSYNSITRGTRLFMGPESANRLRCSRLQTKAFSTYRERACSLLRSSTCGTATNRPQGVERGSPRHGVNFPREAVLGELVGGVWHTTNQERFLRILEWGTILPEPDISEHGRWGTAAGPEGYPYVRSIGGVSLFDFRGFEAESYS